MNTVRIEGTVRSIVVQPLPSGKEIAFAIVHVGPGYQNSEHLVAVKAFGQNMAYVKTWHAGDKVELEVMPESREHNGKWYSDIVLRNVNKHDAKPQAPAGSEAAPVDDSSVPF